MTQEQTKKSRIVVPPLPGLQPVRLPLDAWAEFSQQLSEALEELERRHHLPYGQSPVLRNSAPGNPR